MPLTDNARVRGSRPACRELDRSRTVTGAEVEAPNYDLKAVNPHAKPDEDLHASEALPDLIEAKGKEVAEALKELRE